MRCPKCQKILRLANEIIEKNQLTYNPATRLLERRSNVQASDLSCLACGHILTISEAEGFGLKNFGVSARAAFGTEFYKIYASAPDIYHEFSLAEDPDGVLTERILEYCQPDTTVLDVGSGSGKLSRALAASVSTVYALEPSSSLLDFSLKQSKDAGIENVIHLLASAEDVPLPEQSVDLVTMTWTAMCPYETLTQVTRVLKPGGYAIRVGASTKDELTSLYPDVDSEAFSRTNSWFEGKGFQTSRTTIRIVFKSIAAAQRVMGTIVGAPIMLDTNVLNHEVVFQVYRHL